MTMKIIVGSTALKHFGLNRSEPKDVDVWTDNESDLIAGTDSHLIPSHILLLVPRKDWYATPDAIYTIKCSHAEFVWFLDWVSESIRISVVLDIHARIVDTPSAICCDLVYRVRF